MTNRILEVKCGNGRVIPLTVEYENGKKIVARTDKMDDRGDICEIEKRELSVRARFIDAPENEFFVDLNQISFYESHPRTVVDISIASECVDVMVKDGYDRYSEEAVRNKALAFLRAQIEDGQCEAKIEKRPNGCTHYSVFMNEGHPFNFIFDPSKEERWMISVNPEESTLMFAPVLMLEDLESVAHWIINECGHEAEKRKQRIKLIQFIEKQEQS